MRGQQGTTQLVFPTDAYGNAQPIDYQWRSIDVYQNPIQQEALEGYQTSSRRYGQRSGLEPFGLPGDVWAVSRLVASGTPEAPGVAAGISRAKRQAFRRYGGFGERAESEPQEGMAAFVRRQALIAATGLNAPVYRAINRDRSMVDLRSAIARTPFLESELEPPDREAPPLEARLDRTDAAEHERVRKEAWALFRESQFRRALRMFEAAITLEPTESVSRIGEIICHLAVGARRTAVALLAELVRRDENPFGHDLTLRDRFGSTGEINTLILQSRQATANPEQNVHIAAVYTMTLWYLNERDEALRAAEAIARRAPTEPYVVWPAKMRAVLEAAGAPPAPTP